MYFLVTFIHLFSFLQKTLRFHYEGQAVNDLLRNNLCDLLVSQETRNYAVWANSNFLKLLKPKTYFIYNHL